MNTSSSSPSTPIRTPRKNLRHDTVSPYFSRVLTVNSLPSSSSDHHPDSSPSSKKSRKSKVKRSSRDDTLSLSILALNELDFVDDDTYLKYGISGHLLKDPLYAFHLRKFTRLYTILWKAKPILIQERVSECPWKLFIAVMLLNKTAGKMAIPIFWDILRRWETPEALSQANPSDLKDLIQPLGLHETRSKRMIELSRSYLTDPPQFDILRPTKAYLVPVQLDESRATIRERYPPTPASHLPGCGPYALDSYRIFCMPGDEWKSVMPADKELIKYMKWKWALFEQRRWDPAHGAVGAIDLKYLAELPLQVTLTN